MASLQELRSLFLDSDLTEKVEAAIIIAANNLLSGTPTVPQKVWAAAVFSSPKAEARKALMAILAVNSGASVSAIQGASDTTIQNGVDGVVQILVDAFGV